MKKGSILIILMAVIFSLPLQAQLRKANKQFELYHFSKAIPLYEQVIEKGKSERKVAEATARLADSYRLTGDVMKAVIWYQQAVKHSQNDPINYYYLGQSLKSATQYHEARNAFLKYAELVPDDPRGKALAEHCLLINDWEAIVKPIEIRNMESVNSDAADFSPTYYKNGIVFTTDRAFVESGKSQFDWTERGYTSLMYAEPRFLNDLWNGLRNPGNVPGLQEQKYHDGPAVFTKDNTEVYITRTTRERVRRKKEGYRTHNLKIFSAQIGSTDRKEYQPFFLNSDDYSVAHPTLSEDGRMIIFASDMPGGFGGMDLYYCTWEDNKWGEAVNLGSEINTFGNEVFPILLNDDKLYFASDGLPGFGGLDMFVSELDSTGKWTKPENLYKPLNSSYDDFGIVFNDEQTSGFFSSSRPGGKGLDDIYAFRATEIATPHAITELSLSGYVKDKRNLMPVKNSTVFVLNTKHNKVKILKTNADGYFESSAEKDAIYLVKAVKEDYIQDCLEFRIDGLESATMINTPRDLLLDKLEVDKVFTIDNIYYDFDKWDIRPDAAAELNKLVQIMLENPISIELGSHTDSRGSDTYNMRLSQRRAESAVTYLISQGITYNRLVARGYGESRLTNHCTNGVDCSPEEHQANRRTEFKVLGFDRSLQTQRFDYSSYQPGDELYIALFPSGFFSDCLVMSLTEADSPKLEISKEVSQLPPSETAKTQLILHEQATQTEETENCYSVQLLASQQTIDLDDPLWRDVEQLRYYYDGNLYRYITGCDPDLTSARNRMRYLRSNGYPDAFTVKVNNGIVTPAN